MTNDLEGSIWPYPLTGPSETRTLLVIEKIAFAAEHIELVQGVDCGDEPPQVSGEYHAADFPIRILGHRLAWWCPEAVLVTPLGLSLPTMDLRTNCVSMA